MTHGTRYRIAVLVFAVALVWGCTDAPVVFPGDQRPCAIDNHNDVWTDFNFGGSITQPDTCPLLLDELQQEVPFTGMVAFGNNGDWATDANGFVQIFANLGFGNYQNVTEPSTTIDIDYQFDDLSGLWEGNFNGSYFAASEPPGVQHPEEDTAVFRTTIDATFESPSGGGFPEVDAGAVLPWTQQVSNAVQGPSSVGRFDTFTLEAIVNNGKEPLAYQWYRDGTPIGTNSATYQGSATALQPGTGYSYKVVITDAEGDTGMTIHPVYVSESGDGQCLKLPCSGG